MKDLFYKLKSKYTFFILTFFVSITICIYFYDDGLPYINKNISFIIPNKICDSIDKAVFYSLDKHYFKKSQLSQNEKIRIKNLFKTNIEPFLIKNKSFKINFRNLTINNKKIAKAYSLPNRNIILTDKLIKSVKNDDEITAIVLHEIGHIINKHPIERIIKNGLFSILISNILINRQLPYGKSKQLATLFIDNHFTIKFELDADKYAYSKMLEAHINPINFNNIIYRIKKYSINKHLDDIYKLSFNRNFLKRDSLEKKFQYCYEKGIFPCE